MISRAHVDTWSFRDCALSLVQGHPDSGRWQCVRGTEQGLDSSQEGNPSLGLGVLGQPSLQSQPSYQLCACLEDLF